MTGAAAGGRPFFVYFAPHAPHNPAKPADWYADACTGVASPRTPNYNHTHPSFHELIARQPPLTEADATLIDELARRRCQTLLSVDDAHAAIIATLKELGKFDNSEVAACGHAPRFLSRASLRPSPRLCRPRVCVPHRSIFHHHERSRI